MRAITTVLLLSFCSAFSASEVLPSANDFQTLWRLSGFGPSGIPYRTTIATTLNPGATAAQIETACNTTAQSNEVVFLNAGTYNISGEVNITKSGVTLRGATNSFGKPTTILNFGSSASGWALVDISKAVYPPENGTWPGVSSVNINSGLTKGSTSITVASAPGSFTVGQIFVIDAHEDGTYVRAEESTQGPGSQYSRVGNRPLMQVCHCTNVSGTTIQFEPPLSTDWFTNNAATLDPEMYWWDNDYSETVRYTGIEDLIVIQNVNGGSSQNINIGPAAYCWARNIWTTNVPNNGSGFAVKWTFGCEVQDCLVSKHDQIGSGTYAYEFSVGTWFRMANCIGSEIPCLLNVRGAVLGVLFGNYGTNYVYTDSTHMTETMMFHGSHSYAILMEANYTPKIISDYIHGDASFSTVHRNRLTGWESGKTGYTSALALETNSLNFALIGNVIGHDGYHLNYESGAAELYDFSTDNGTAYNSMTRKGNYNTVDDGIRAGESMGTDTNAYSYAYASKPTWWGDRPWPWVKATSTSDSLEPAKATNQPAGFRFLLGSNPPPATAGGGDPVIGNPSPFGIKQGSNIRMQGPLKIRQ